MTPGVLVDTNVLVDIATDDPRWGKWSIDALQLAGSESRLIISPVVYAETSVAYESIEALDRFLPESVFVREDLPWEAAFLAGKAFMHYRKRGGEKRSPLPDFFIGAHAAVRTYAVLSRDRGRFATYFPTVPLIAPGDS